MRLAHMNCPISSSGENLCFSVKSQSLRNSSRHVVKFGIDLRKVNQQHIIKLICELVTQYLLLYVLKKGAVNFPSQSLKEGPLLSTLNKINAFPNEGSSLCYSNNSILVSENGMLIFPFNLESVLPVGHNIIA